MYTVAKTYTDVFFLIRDCFLRHSLKFRNAFLHRRERDGAFRAAKQTELKGYGIVWKLEQV